MGGRWFRPCRFNPPAHPDQGWARGVLNLAVHTCPIHKNPSLPGSACPAEESTFTTFFYLFLASIFLPKILPKASPRASPGIPKSAQNRVFPLEVCPKSRFLVDCCSQLCFLRFSCRFWPDFRSKINVFFVALLHIPTPFFQHADLHDLS